MRDLLFDVPWYLPTLGIIIGLTLLFGGNRRQNPRQRNVGAILVLIAVGWAVMSYLVDTPKEICQKQTRAFIQSVVDRNWSTFDNLLEPGVNFKFIGSPWEIDGRDPLTNAVKADVEQIGLKSAMITEAAATESGGTITVAVKLFTNQTYTMERPIDSDWEWDWRETDGHWRIHEIRALRVSGADPSQVRGGLRVK
jgi:hypothetical protein